MPLHPSNTVASLKMPVIAVTLEVTHFERSPLNAVANKNISFIFVTRVTSQLEISWLNEGASLNMSFMLVTLEVSHSPMIPFVFVPANVGQVPPGVSNKHLSTAVLSSARLFGVNVAAVWSGNQHHSKRQSRQRLQEDGWSTMVVVVVFQ